MEIGNKKFLVVALLLLFVGVGFMTYALFTSTATGTATANVAAWSVKVNTDDIVTMDTFTFNAADIVWNSNQYVATGKIAPGSTGTISFDIDATGSEVAVDYTVTVGTIKVGNSSINNDKISVSPIESTGTIEYSTQSNAMKRRITLNITWTAQDNAEVNSKDMTLAGQTINIPVTVVVTQKVNS